MTSTPEFFALVQDDLKSVESLIRQQMEGLHPDLGVALDLILSAGGKRLRPAISILVGKMLKAPREQYLTVAASIELLHTATLVHDDLIDGSLLRRGQPTLNSRWSAPATVLTGDLLFACAAKLAAGANSTRAMQLFAQTLRVMVNGEITQLLTSPCTVSREDYYQRIYAKTASLFETSSRAVALVSPAQESEIDAISDYGREMGMAFQIVDDILDYTGSQAAIGKPVGSDLRQGLVTLPALFYIETNPEDPDCLALISSNCLKGEERVGGFVKSVVRSGAVDASRREADQYVEKSLRALKSFAPGEERQALEEIAGYITERKI